MEERCSKCDKIIHYDDKTAEKMRENGRKGGRPKKIQTITIKCDKEWRANKKEK